MFECSTIDTKAGELWIIHSEQEYDDAPPYRVGLGDAWDDSTPVEYFKDEDAAWEYFHSKADEIGRI